MAKAATASKPQKSRRADAYQQILLAIVLGDLEAGSRIDEMQIVRDFKLGHAAVRDALFRLSLEGLVERHARIGTRVADLSLRNLQELFEARLVIESYAAALAAERATPADIAAIRATLAEHDEAVDAKDFRRLALMDIAFHTSIAKAARNSEVERMLVQLHNSASRFWWFSIHRTTAEEMKAQGKAHLNIVDAIEAKDFVEIQRRVRAVMGYNPDRNMFVYEPVVSMRVVPDADAQLAQTDPAPPKTVRKAARSKA